MENTLYLSLSLQYCIHRQGEYRMSVWMEDTRRERVQIWSAWFRILCRILIDVGLGVPDGICAVKNRSEQYFIFLVLSAWQQKDRKYNKSQWSRKLEKRIHSKNIMKDFPKRHNSCKIILTLQCVTFPDILMLFIHYKMQWRAKTHKGTQLPLSPNIGQTILFTRIFCDR